MLPLQIFLQHNRGGKSVNGHFAFRFGLSLWCMQIFARRDARLGIQGSAALLFEQTLGFPTGKTFVDHFDRHANLFADTLGKARSFFGHFAVGAVKAQGKADDNLRYTLLASEFAEAAHIFVAIDAFQRGQWLGEARCGVGDGQANSSAAIIERHNGSGLIFGREQLRHLLSIPGGVGTKNRSEAAELLHLQNRQYRYGVGRQRTRWKETAVSRQLWFSAAGASLPVVPKTHGFHLLVETGFFHESVEFGAGQALAEGSEAIGESPSGERGDGGVQF
jgi:hypothetical protein